MSLWDYVREYRHIAFFVLVVGVYAASWRVRQRRPDVEALKKLASSLAGFIPLLFVIGFLALHRNSELGGAADMMMVLSTLAAIERFHAVLDAWRVVMGKAPTETVERLAEARSAEAERTAIPPTAEPPRARVEVAEEEEAEGSAEVRKLTK
jgi:hypothetical protein